VNTYRISLLALIEVHAVLRDIHAITGPDPRGLITGPLYSRLVSAEATLGGIVDRIASRLDLEVTE
jgi:hypothetical protein